MTQEQRDPVVDEIREIRQRLSARFHDDPAQLVAHYMELQDRHRDRLIASPPSEPPDHSAA